MDWTLVEVTNTPNGTVLSNPDGTVRSLNPASVNPPSGPYTWSAMPAGTDGQYEVCDIEGGFVSYNPTAQQPVVFAYKAKNPNTTLAGISIQPL